MNSFTIKPDSFKEIRKIILARLLPVFAVIVLILIVVRSFRPPEPRAIDSWVVTISITTGVLLYVTYNTLKRQKQMYESFRLTITPDAVIREQFNTPDITIPRNSVKEIIKGKNGAFAIIGESKLNAIVVPAQIEQPEELERLLSEIKPITVKTVTPWPQKLILPAMLTGILLLFGGLSAENIFIFSISGLGAMGLLIAGFIIIQRGKNFDRRMKRISYIILVPFLSILAMIIMKWLE